MTALVLLATVLGVIVWIGVLFFQLGGFSKRTPLLAGDGEYAFEVEIESHRYPVIAMAAGVSGGVYVERPALVALVPEAAHSQEPDTVRVEFGRRRVVGHLRPQDAALYLEDLWRLGLGGETLRCWANVRGVWSDEHPEKGRFTVYLDLEWPLRLEA